MSVPPEEPAVAAGLVQDELLAEFPGLELRFSVIDVQPGPSSPALRERLRALSDRYGGAAVVTLRTKAIAHAYRAFYRQVGLDPDVTRIPSEEAAVARLLQGGFKSRDRLADARLIALVETGAPVWALDAHAVEPATLGIRLSRAGEELGAGPAALPLAPGRLVLADHRAVHGVLFGMLDPRHLPGRRTRRVLIFSVGVDGVPALYLEEALWLCAELAQRR
ncbi:MAG TPA: hypothetical protein VE992_01165 [Solirubrobacteraceae bacterium]|nr:hypothetical protein [Solirubrobacteraceae bacterium]